MSDSDTEAVVALATVAAVEAGRMLARTLVEERLAACVQVIPGGTAIYRWQGRIYDEAQTQLIIKTRRAMLPRLQERVLALHGDETPEFLVLPVIGGLPAYLQWVAEETGDA